MWRWLHTLVNISLVLDSLWEWLLPADSCSNVKYKMQLLKKLPAKSTSLACFSLYVCIFVFFFFFTVCLHQCGVADTNVL